MLVVAGTHIVHVGILHQLQVFEPMLITHRTAHIGVLVVTIHATQLHGLAVDAQHAITGTYLTDTDLLSLAVAWTIGIEDRHL